MATAVGFVVAPVRDREDGLGVVDGERGSGHDARGTFSRIKELFTSGDLNFKSQNGVEKQINLELRII